MENTASSRPVYASFKDRLLSGIIDWIVLGILIGIVYLTTFGLVGSVAITWLYYALFESSASQATPGKQAAGLKVTSLDGSRINFWQAAGRYLIRFISYGLFFFGVFLMFFTDKRQTLHDLITGTVVVRKYA